MRSFSVETMSTVGYGEMYPATLYGPVVVTIDVVMGVLLVRLATGLVIAKFTLLAARGALNGKGRPFAPAQIARMLTA
jgi:hypothetical protein